MAGSFMARLRARIEQLQTELQPEAGIDRRAYGYGDGADDEDATFEEVAQEEESPWRRGPSGPMPSADEPGRAGGPTGPGARLAVTRLPDRRRRARRPRP